jgi:hypothetical protein
MLVFFIKQQKLPETVLSAYGKKVKFTLYQSMRVQRGSRGIDLLFL